jgi:hypothetical protein
MIRSVGNMGLEEANHANIPVSIFITKPEGAETGWELSANNYMPRKNYIAEGEYKYYADTKEELVGLVRKYVIPTYETAIRRMQSAGELYYWEEPEEK